MIGSPGGFALRCDRSGRLLAVIRDDAGLAAGFVPGALFPALVERACMDKALDFLVEIRESGAAFDRELVIAAPGGNLSLHFVGSIVDDMMLIAANLTLAGIEDILDDLLRIGSEQTVLIRSLRKDFAEREPPSLRGAADSRRTPAPRVSSAPRGSPSVRGSQDPLFDEISRLNNELVNAQRELSHKNAELARLDALKNRFLGMAAHDLRSPLASCLAYLDLLLEEEGIDGATLRTWTDRIRQTMEFMLALVNDLLDTAAIESGKLRLVPRETDVVSLVTEVIGSNRLLADRREVEIRRTDSLESCRGSMDRVRMNQALNNLLSNAVKFTPRGGLVEIGVERGEGSVAVAIVDHGPGMGPEQLARLFTPFGSPTQQSADGEKNTGLGLLISRRIAEAHGGSLLIESEPGKGTRAEIRIPLGGQSPEEEADADIGTAASVPAAGTGDGGSASVGHKGGGHAGVGDITNS